MGFFKSLFSSPQISEEQQQEQVSVEKKRIAFETLRDGGVRAITLKEYKLAEDYFVKAIELNSDDEEIKALLAEAYLGENKMEDALKILKPMSEKHPDNPRIWISMAQAALQLENWEEVLKFCAEYERLDSVKASVYYYEGMAFYGLKDYDSAVMRFGKAIDLSDNFVMAYYMRSKAYFLQNKIEEAEKDVHPNARAVLQADGELGMLVAYELLLAPNGLPHRIARGGIGSEQTHVIRQMDGLPIDR